MALYEGLKLANPCSFISPFIIAILVDVDWYLIWFWLGSPIRICLQCKRPGLESWLGKIPWERDRLPIPVFLGFPGALDGKESDCNEGDLSLIPWEDPLEEDKATHSTILSGRIPMDRGAWPATVHGIAKSWTWLSN